jgi:hypothetical protein
VRQCVAVCGSTEVRGTVQQCGITHVAVQQYAAVRQCAAVCGSAALRVWQCGAVCGSDMWECARQCMAVRSTYKKGSYMGGM